MQLSPISLAITRLGGVRFSPSALFSSGEQGAWYDPSDLTTLFQDSAGTTPVTAVEQPVGLVLDKSKGLVLGPELVTNGDFSQGSTGWTAGAGWSIAGGVATGAAASTNLLQTNVAPSPSGKTYRVTLTIVTRTAGSIVPAISGSSVTLTNPGTYTFYLFPTGSDATLYISGVGFTGTITNISVKALPGNHAYQTTSASRPTLRARYNLLTYSEQFDNAVWSRTGSVSITANSDTAPDGSITADRFVSTGGSFPQIAQAVTLAAGDYTLSMWVRSDGTSQIAQALILDGTAVSFTPTATWTRITVTKTGVLAGSRTAVVATNSGTAPASSFYIWGAQLVPTAVFPSNTYQRIAAATDYATGAAFPVGLDADGVDDGLLTNSVDFSATDKMTVWAGVTKSSDAAVGILAELSSDFNGNAGSFNVAPNSNALAAAPNYAAASKGSAAPSTGQYAVSATVTAPITNVSTSQFNISGNLSALRINGSASGTNGTNSQGAGNFGNYPLYIGRRGNATLPLNGRIYSLIIRGAQSTAAQISSTESWVAAKTPLGSL